MAQQTSPAFLRLVADPIRWRLLLELSRSDRAVRELTDLLGEQQSLVSYHLGQLRAAELVRSRRSSADGRDSYYAIDLTRFAEEMQSVGGELHPALWLVPAPPSPAARGRRTRRRPSVLFLCTGNSARSQIAEALTAQLSGGTVEVASAGSRPKPLHANAVEVMRERGIDISANQTKHVDELASRRFDVVVTLCDKVREVCPELPGRPDLVHWSLADPSLDGPDDRSTFPAFERTTDELESRIRHLLRTLEEPATGRSDRAER